jgi:hypothetical protein
VRVLSVPDQTPNDMTFLALALQSVLIHESLEANWPPRVDPYSADPDLGAEAIAKAVREARTRVHKYASRVNAARERAAG